MQPEGEFRASKSKGIQGKKLAFRGGEQHAHYADKSHGAITAKHRASEGETPVGSLTLLAACTSSSDLRYSNIYYCDRQ
jgi:hypothetical protein